MGQSQQQNNSLPSKHRQDDSLDAQKKAKRKRLREIDTKDLLTEKPEDFLKKIKQTPGQ